MPLLVKHVLKGQLKLKCLSIRFWKELRELMLMFVLKDEDLMMVKRKKMRMRIKQMMKMKRRNMMKTTRMMMKMKKNMNHLLLMT